MSKVTASKARDEMAEILNRVSYRNDRVILERRGKEVAAVISIEDLKLFERLVREEEDRIDEADIQIAQEEIKEHGAISWEDVKRDLDQ